jgi:LNR domain
MMFIRLLAVLGALVTLAMAGTPAFPTPSPTKEKVMSPKAPKHPKATKSKSKPTGPPPPKVCGPPYDKGCPCYNQKDVDALLALAAKSEGNCAYSVSFSVRKQEMFLDARPLTESNQTIVNYLVLQDFPTNQSDSVDKCIFDYFGYRVYDENPNIDFEVSFFTKLEGSLAATFSSCEALLKDAKDDMLALNCSIECECSTYGNGECTPDGDGCVCFSPNYDPAAFCDTCLDGYFGYFKYNCELYYPNCTVDYPDAIRIGDGSCSISPEYYTEECGYDGGDCCTPDDNRTRCEVPNYPNCSAPIPRYIGNGFCDGEFFNTTECGFDGGDCLFVTTGATTSLSKNPKYSKEHSDLQEPNRPETPTLLEQMLCKPASIKDLGK